MKTDFRTLPKEELLSQTRNLVDQEREVTLKLIEALREIERRMLYADLGYASLFEFCIKHLSLSEGSAQRRIAAMRLVRDLPEVKRSLETGSLSLTNAAKLHSVFQAKKKQRQELKAPAKIEVLNQVMGLTQRECESKLYELLPEAVKATRQERERVISQDAVELKLVVSGELHRKLLRLKELLSHTVPDGSYVKILERLTDQEIEKLESRKGLRKRKGALSRSISESTATPVPVERSQSKDAEVCTGAAVSGREEDRDIAVGSVQRPSDRLTTDRLKNRTTDLKVVQRAQATTRATKVMQESSQNTGQVAQVAEKGVTSTATVRRLVWRRSSGMCQYPGCKSRYRLEVDHIVPKALGGKGTLDNLRMLCRTHNLQQAQEKLGESVMKSYVPSLR